MSEEWRTIIEFPGYQISDMGNIYNLRTRRLMRTNPNQFGNMKIWLTDYFGQGHTRSVAMLVANAFVEQPNDMCTYLMVLDGDLSNIEASNLAWRPRWFAWKYTRQLKLPQPLHYKNLPVLNLLTGEEYESIIEAGMTNGELFYDIWESTYRGNPLYPHGSVYEVIKKV